MSTWSVSAARAALPEIIACVERGEEVTLTRRGRPVARVVAAGSKQQPPGNHVANPMSAAEVKRLWDEAATLPFEDTIGLSAEYADELVREIRADRDTE